MKLFALGSLGLVVANASAAPAAAQTFEGPYAGVQAGWNKNKVGSASTDIGRADVDRSRDSGTADVFVGYTRAR